MPAARRCNICGAGPLPRLKNGSKPTRCLPCQRMVADEWKRRRGPWSIDEVYQVEADIVERVRRERGRQ